MVEERKPRIIDVNRPVLEEKEPPGPPEYETIFEYEKTGSQPSSGKRRTRTKRKETKKRHNFMVLLALLLVASMAVNVYIGLTVVDLKTKVVGLEESRQKQKSVGEGVLRVTLLEATKTRVVVQVEDNGAGIKNLILHYATSATLNTTTPWSDVLMREVQKGVFSYTFPFTESVQILYYIEAQDSAGSVTYTKPGMIAPR